MGVSGACGSSLAGVPTCAGECRLVRVIRVLDPPRPGLVLLLCWPQQPRSAVATAPGPSVPAGRRPAAAGPGMTYRDERNVRRRIKPPISSDIRVIISAYLLLRPDACDEVCTLRSSCYARSRPLRARGCSSGAGTWCDDRGHRVRRRIGRRCGRRRWSWCGRYRFPSQAVRAARGGPRVTVVSAPAVSRRAAARRSCCDLGSARRAWRSAPSG